jgi:hypothetical protein
MAMTFASTGTLYAPLVGITGPMAFRQNRHSGAVLRRALDERRRQEARDEQLIGVLGEWPQRIQGERSRQLRRIGVLSFRSW